MDFMGFAWCVQLQSVFLCISVMIMLFTTLYLQLHSGWKSLYKDYFCNFVSKLSYVYFQIKKYLV